MEKLHFQEFESIPFYFVDVNEVPRELVEGNGVSCMPTLTLHKNGKVRTPSAARTDGFFGPANVPLLPTDRGEHDRGRGRGPDRREAA